MNIEQVAFVVIGLAITAIVCVTVLVAIPYMARLTALYKLHSTRDDLFEMGMKAGYRNTLVYRDLDALLAGAISVLRTGTSREAVHFFTTMSPSSEPKNPGWRARQIRAEIDNVFIDSKEREFIFSISDTIKSAMATRVAFSSPPFYIFLLAIAVKSIVGLVAKKSMESLEAVSIDKFSRQHAVGSKDVWQATKEYCAS